MYNILICDDEMDIVSALSIYLSSENYNVFSAYTGQEALDAVENNDIHLWELSYKGKICYTHEISLPEAKSWAVNKGFYEPDDYPYIRGIMI